MPTFFRAWAVIAGGGKPPGAVEGREGGAAGGGGHCTWECLLPVEPPSESSPWSEPLSEGRDLPAALAWTSRWLGMPAKQANKSCSKVWQFGLRGCILDPNDENIKGFVCNCSMEPPWEGRAIRAAFAWT